MMKRSLVGLLAAGIVALTATPAAAAAEIDFGVELRGGTVARDVSYKGAEAAVTNHGTTKPESVRLTVDLTELDRTKVQFDADDAYCTIGDETAECDLPEFAIADPGHFYGWGLGLRPTDAAAEAGPGPLGRLTVTVAVEGDTNPANDTRTLDVTLAGNGGDLVVGAAHVADEQTGAPVKPGATEWARAYVANVGDTAIKGVRIELELPEQVTFTDEVQGCEYSADKRKLVCIDADHVLIPFQDDETAEKWDSSAEAGFRVTVAADAEGPAELKGGKWTVTPLGLAPAEAPATRSRTTSSFLTPARAEAQPEVDLTDNTSTFLVKVAEPDEDDGDGGGTGGGDDDGPGLPITGPGAGAMAGVGIGFVLLGVVLVVMSRRRPDSELQTL
jgi:hypothetical protein